MIGNKIYSKMNKLFENETVIISGGMGDIGRAMALEFAKHGANIALCDMHPPTACQRIFGTT